MWDLQLEGTPVDSDKFKEADRKSAAPIEVDCVLSVRTVSGIQRQFTKPRGSYGFVNPDIVARNRQRQVERFEELTRLLEAEEPHSGIRSTQHTTKKEKTGT